MSYNPLGGSARPGRERRTMERKEEYSADEQMAIGKEIRDGLLTIPAVAEKYGVDYYAARRWYRRYAKDSGLGPKRRGYSGLEARTAPAGIEELESMTRDQLIDEVIKARAEAERAKKGYTVRGGGQGKEFLPLGNPNSR